ncbi:hypothetical protein [Lentibacillus sp. CBA3610]|uniref:hypothetical protein n=1 Tax=Lentibacillus sp. CBA3610 TaxID=2518176 RepID=UPI0015956D9D|nr:hypothetical protein [Lentibacillus sp. CBA3610]
MEKRKRKNERDNDVTAPGIDPDDSYGEPATRAEIEKGESTRVTRLRYDAYEPSENDD